MDDLEQMEAAEENIRELVRSLEYERHAYEKNFIGQKQFESSAQNLVEEYEFEMSLVDSVQSRLSDGAYFTGDPAVEEALKTDVTNYASKFTDLVKCLSEEVDVSISSEHEYISAEKTILGSSEEEISDY